MPELEHVGNDLWVKECTVCGSSFQVKGITHIIAYASMLDHFGASSYKKDELKSECKSCSSDKQHNRVTANREQLLIAQDNKCGICAKEISFKNSTAQVDHDHKTGKTRKVLCKLCNRHMAAIDNEEWVKLGIAYRDSFR